MASIFVTSKNVNAEGFFGKDINVPFYLQFVAGLMNYQDLDEPEHG